MSHAARSPGQLVVVVPARNEVDRVTECLSSLTTQAVPLRVLFSDNASDDGTAAAATAFADRLHLTVRITEPLRASEHFVSAGRWALATVPEAEYFALLAGDDAWHSDFARSALEALDHHPGSGAVFPAFVWREDGAPDRLLPPMTFLQTTGRVRQHRALLLSDRRELSNLVYGVYRRRAFEDLLAAWERGGEAFGCDYAAAWSVLGHYPVASCPAAVGVRHVRPGVDLIARVDLGRERATSSLGLAVLYVRLNLRVNRLIAAALERAADGAPSPGSLRVQVLRSPQWLAGSLRHARGSTVGSRRDG